MILKRKTTRTIQKLVPVSIFHSKIQVKWSGIEPVPSQGRVSDWSIDPWRSLEPAGSSIVCYCSLYNTCMLNAKRFSMHVTGTLWSYMWLTFWYSQPSQATRNSEGLSRKLQCLLCFSDRQLTPVLGYYWLTTAIVLRASQHHTKIRLRMMNEIRTKSPGGMTLTVLTQKLVPVPICPSVTLAGIVWDNTRASVASGWRLTA